MDNLVSDDSHCPEKKTLLGKGAASLLLIILWLGAAMLQFKNEAFSSDIGADPDEPAHVVTTLMMRDYLVSGLWHGEHPMHFAQRYYDHFPKVAIGHYPPGFYVAAGLWLLPAASSAQLLMFMSFLAALLGTLTAVLACRCGLNRASACLVGAWLVLLPLTQKQTMLVMSDLLLAVGCLLALAAFAAFLDKPTAGRALLFGAFAAATILTKASGVALALIPPTAILAQRRWSLLWNWRLWLAPLPVLLTALPWTLLTMHITEEGMQAKSVATYLPEALQFYTQACGYTFGPWILLGALTAVGLGLRTRGRDATQAPALPVVLALWVPSLLLLYLVSPTGTSSRYLLPIAPTLLIGAAWSASQLQRLWLHRLTAMTAVLTLAACSLWMLSPVPPKKTHGFGQIARSLTQRAAGGKVLVSSDARGEGSLIAELALQLNHRPESAWTVVRVSKFAASSDWIGRGYQLKYGDVPQLAAAITRENIRWLIIDDGVPAYLRLPHHDQMKQWSSTRKPVLEVPATRLEEPGESAIALFETIP